MEPWPWGGQPEQPWAAMGSPERVGDEARRDRAPPTGRAVVVLRANGSPGWVMPALRPT